MLPSPFSLLAPPNWRLDPSLYPTVYLVDMSWAETPGQAFGFESRSLTTQPITGDPFHTPRSLDNHGERTRHVVMTVARGLTEQQVVLVSAMRRNELCRFVQEATNLPEALIHVQLLLNLGDLVVINIGPNGPDDAQDSFASDSLITLLLQQITDVLGGIVVIAAGDGNGYLSSVLLQTIVVVGGVSDQGAPLSRFGDSVTCYGVVPYNLPGTDVLFPSSSAATAYTAGMVLMMLNYAKSKGLTLTSKQVSNLLKTNGTAFSLPPKPDSSPENGVVPDWDKLQPAIDRLTNPAN